MEIAASFAKGWPPAATKRLAPAFIKISQHQGTVTMPGFLTFTGHEEIGRQGHRDAATRASVESALHAADNIEAGEVIVSMLGSYVILEGFVRRRGDVERAVEIAESIVGRGYVRSRMLHR
ncbi:osmotically-inducible protein OsmY [Rhizobium pisi]|uniref:BON domain-containing protein n=2 Tax=Rhizobium fabae TaxID=573179 RepID=A0A7W6BCE8_9HYPH|nr:hypothetical protein [Rhizobium fabae]